MPRTREEEGSTRPVCAPSAVGSSSASRTRVAAASIEPTSAFEASLWCMASIVPTVGSMMRITDVGESVLGDSAPRARSASPSLHAVGVARRRSGSTDDCRQAGCEQVSADPAGGSAPPTAALHATAALLRASPTST